MNIISQAFSLRWRAWSRGLMAIVLLLGMAAPLGVTVQPVLAQSGSIGDFVWYDYNGNGIQDADEPGISGVTVNLLDADGDPVFDGDGNPVTTVSDGYGRYEFIGLPPGDYILEFIAPPGAYTFTLQNQGDDPALSSDANPITGRTGTITLLDDQERTDIDAGFVPNYCTNFYLDWGGLGFVNGLSSLQTFTNVHGSGVDLTTEFLVVDENYDDLGLYVPPVGQTYPAVGSSFLALRDISVGSYPDAGRIKTEIIFSEPIRINEYWFEPFFRWTTPSPDVNKHQAIQAFDDQGDAVVPVSWASYDGSDLHIEPHPINGQAWLRSRYDINQTTYSGSYHINFGDQLVKSIHWYSWGEDQTTGALRHLLGSTYSGGFFFCVPTDVEIWVEKTGSASPVTAGEAMTYSLTIYNDGPSAAENVVVTDTLPAEVTFVSASPTPDSGPNPLVWNLGTLTAGESRDILITVTVNADVTAGFTNMVIITTTTPGDDPSNNEDDWPVEVVLSADLGVVKSDDPDPVSPGALLTYTLNVTNYGPGLAENVLVTDTLPAEVQYVGADPAHTYIAPDTVIWSLGDLLPGETRDLTLTVQVHPWVTQTFTNVVVVGSDTPDDNPDNNQDDEPTTPLVPGLELVKTVQPAIVAPNMPFTYVIAITNTGHITLDPLVLTDTLPSLDFHYVAGSASPSEPAVVAPPLLVWTDLGPLDPGASLTVSFAVTVTPGITPNTYVNVALAAGEHPGGVITDTDDVPISVQEPAIEINKQLVAYDAGLISPNFVTYTFTITNVGPSEIDYLPVYDLYDAAYLHFAYAFPVTPDTVDNVNGRIAWNDMTSSPPHGFGYNLRPGESFQVTTVFTVVQDIDRPITNTVGVSDAEDVYDNPVPPEEDDEVIDEQIPTAVTLSNFYATVEAGGIRVAWTTTVELDNFGFRLLRATEPDVTRAGEIAFIASACRGNLCGATYDYLDTTVQPEFTYWYWLEDVDTSGVTTLHGPVSSRVSGAALTHRLFLPLVLSNR